MKSDSTPVRVRAAAAVREEEELPRKGAADEVGSERASLAERRESRAAFVSRFAPLLDQIAAARSADIYPFYEGLDPARCGGRLREPLVLVQNDYLGLSRDERVREAARRAIAEHGTSRCSSPLAGGHTELHRELEARLASFLGQEAAVLFASGYQANVGAIAALMQRGDLVVTDLFDHASIVDGARLSGADYRFFQHNRPAHLEQILSKVDERRRVLVVVEGIYSADGDVVALPEICEIAHARGALVMIDEAHSFGVLGPRGRGAAEAFGMLGHVDLIMGTMSKSLASVGGFVTGDRCLVDAIAHSARSLIFSAALPPAGVAAAATALGILEREPGIRERLWRNARAFLDGLNERGLDTMGSATPVIPLRVGDPERTLALASRLRDRGVLVCPAIPPMVPGRLSRVRGHVTAAHDVDRLCAAIPVIEEECDALGIGRSRIAGARREPSAPSANAGPLRRARGAGGA